MLGDGKFKACGISSSSVVVVVVAVVGVSFSFVNQEDIEEEQSA